ncbi:hypothetical protein ACFL7M_15610 [Thermodesulfobacteriota bacterium]
MLEHTVNRFLIGWYTPIQADIISAVPLWDFAFQIVAESTPFNNPESSCFCDLIVKRQGGERYIYGQILGINLLVVVSIFYLPSL